MDGDILIFAASEIARKWPLLTEAETEIHFSPSEMLTFLGRSVGGRQRKLLRASLQRLKNTLIETNIQGAMDRFSLIEHFDTPLKGRWSVRLPSFFKQELHKQRIATIPQTALKLRGLHRRLYFWARVHAPPRFKPLEISLHRAYEKAGTTDRFAKFHAAIKEIVAGPPLDGIYFGLKGEKGKEFLDLSMQRLSNSLILPTPVDSEHHPSTLDLRGLFRQAEDETLPAIKVLNL
jgi:hypothetical protein